MAEIVVWNLTLLPNEQDHLPLLTKLKASPGWLASVPLITVRNLDTLVFYNHLIVLPWRQV